MWGGARRQSKPNRNIPTLVLTTGRGCIYISNRTTKSRSKITPRPSPMVSASPEITDIRSSSVFDLRKAIVSGLKNSPPTLPTLILYDEPGLKLFEKITYLDEYYLTNCEIEILKTKSDEIVKRLKLEEGGIVVELGSG
jgi:Histidine-specific methyltransferase, SAM-dependent